MKAEKTRRFLRYYHPYHNDNNREHQCEDNEKDGVIEELSELERLAEIGKATEMAFQKTFELRGIVGNGSYGWRCESELVNWYINGGRFMPEKRS